jgi:hypothetical protein
VRAAPAPALALAGAALALALGGCESTQQESAQLERTAHHAKLAERGLSIARPNPNVSVLSAVLLRGGEGTAAAAVTLRNDSSRALDDVPIEITVRNAHGATLYQNTAPGLEAGLTSLPELPAHGEATWVNDQIQASGPGAPASVSALVGEAGPAHGPLPTIAATGVHESEEVGTLGAAGTARNRSSAAASQVIVYVLARRAGRIIAAGRALVPELAAGASAPFQATLTGDFAGARLEASASASG